MFNLLRKHIEKRVHLTDEEFTLCTQFFITKKIKKRQFLLQEGEVCRYTAFVNSGCLRAYTLDLKGNEHIIQFAIGGWWISDLNSFITNSASIYNIEALQNSEVLLLEKSAREKLFEAVPKMERLFRLLIEANDIAIHQRVRYSLSATAEERYLTFIMTYPTLFNQVPQKQIASYLGITPESLSRIRKNLSQKNR